MHVKIIFIVLFSLLVCQFLNSKELHFAFEKYAPYEYMENNTAKGLTIEILNGFCKLNDIIPIYHELSWSAAYNKTIAGDYDAVFSISKNQERLDYFYYTSVPHVTSAVVIAIPISSTKTARSLEDMNKWVVGCVKDNYYGKIFTDCTSINKVMFGNSENCLKRLNSGTLDAVVFNEDVLNHYTKELGLQNTYKILFRIESVHYYIAFSKKKGDVSKKFAEELSVFIKNHVNRSGLPK